MKYELGRGEQWIKNHIRGIYHPFEVSQELDGTDIEVLTIDAPIEDENWSESREVHHQSPKTTVGLLFDNPGYEDIRLDKEPRVGKHREQRLLTQSLKSLRLGQVRHTHSRCYHFRSKGQLKAKCPDRRKGNRMPWERAWKAKKRKWHQKTRSGDWDEVYEENDQAFETSDERFSNVFDYEDIRHCKEFSVHKCWGPGFPI